MTPSPIFYERYLGKYVEVWPTPSGEFRLVVDGLEMELLFDRAEDALAAGKALIENG